MLGGLLDTASRAEANWSSGDFPCGEEQRSLLPQVLYHFAMSLDDFHLLVRLILLTFLQFHGAILATSSRHTLLH